MARRGRKRHGSRKRASIPILPVAAAAAPFLAANPFDLANVKGLPYRLMYRYTGWNNDAHLWDKTQATMTLTMFVVAFVGHKLAGKLGINRHVSRLTSGYLTL